MKPKILLSLGIWAACCGLTNAANRIHRIQFDSALEVSGQKIALKDLSPDLPKNWNDYNYVVIEYKISTPQRFQLGFTTKTGYNELRVMSYVPNAWNKLAIPLSYYTQLPDPAIDLAATFNHARYTGWINLGGTRHKMESVDSIGIRMRKPIGNPTFEIKSVTLSVNDPGDSYLGEKPAVDEFGQSNLVSYPEKALSLAQLQREWRAEENEKVSTAPYNYSKFGGYKQKRVKGTGFFRTQLIDGKWWFIDPEGYVFLSVGVDCVSPGGGGNVRDIEHRDGMYEALPPSELKEKYSHAKRMPYSFGLWNQYRRFGDDFPTKSKELIIKRMDKWGLNTIANWSSMDVMSMNRKAFILPLRDLGISHDLMGLCDVYDKDYEHKMALALKDFVTPLKDNPWLIGYFIGNEPAWLDEENRLCSIILQGKDRPIKLALKQYLSANGDTPEHRKTFIIDCFGKFLETSNRLLKQFDPNHLNLGIRFGNIMKLDERILRYCGQNFDVLSFNCYDLFPNPQMMDRALEIAKLPMIIGEYHFGTIDRGLAQSLWQVDNEVERGVAYRYYTERAYAHPGLIGTGYFQWCDQDLTGRNDGENYNCGLIDVTDRPYKYQVEAMMETAKRLFRIHSGMLKPVNRQPKNARGYELIPDLWNK